MGMFPAGGALLPAAQGDEGKQQSNRHQEQRGGFRDDGDGKGSVAVIQGT